MKTVRQWRFPVMIALLALVVTACGGSDGASATDCTPGAVDGDLNFYNWTEYVDPDLITVFGGEFEVDIVETFYESTRR